MPYQCAKAVCATFCHHIAGALIPIFGPDFPAQCIPPNAPDYGRMVIEPAIIVQSNREAELFRRMHTNTVTSASRTSSKGDRKTFRNTYDESQHHPRERIRRPFIDRDSPYGTDTDDEISPATNRTTSHRLDYTSIPPVATPRLQSSWTSANMPSSHYEMPTPSPWLSAVPRFTSTPSYHPDHSLRSHSRSHHSSYFHPQSSPRHHHYQHHHQNLQHTHAPYAASHQYQWRQPKRSAEHIDADHEYDGGESRTATGPSTAATSPLNDKPSDSSLGPDKNAALLLMNLSVRDVSHSRKVGCEVDGIASETSSPVDLVFPRVKRPRANSL